MLLLYFINFVWQRGEALGSNGRSIKRVILSITNIYLALLVYTLQDSVLKGSTTLDLNQNEVALASTEALSTPLPPHPHLVQTLIPTSHGQSHTTPVHPFPGVHRRNWAPVLLCTTKMSRSQKECINAYILNSKNVRTNILITSRTIKILTLDYTLRKKSQTTPQSPRECYQVTPREMEHRKLKKLK